LTIRWKSGKGWGAWKIFFSRSASSIYQGSKKKEKKNQKKKFKFFSCFCQPLGLWQIRSFGAGA
jgi:hypothetical protein